MQYYLQPKQSGERKVLSIVRIDREEFSHLFYWSTHEVCFKVKQFYVFCHKQSQQQQQYLSASIIVAVVIVKIIYRESGQERERLQSTIEYPKMSHTGSQREREREIVRFLDVDSTTSLGFDRKEENKVQWNDQHCPVQISCFREKRRKMKQE